MKSTFDEKKQPKVVVDSIEDEAAERVQAEGVIEGGRRGFTQWWMDFSASERREKLQHLFFVYSRETLNRSARVQATGVQQQGAGG
ncbi:hypothetical protein FA292_31610 [Pseudomonas aeruginosa]|nr:hypothetical protein [Pseudomonas aeruginosa]